MMSSMTPDNYVRRLDFDNKPKSVKESYDFNKRSKRQQPALNPSGVFAESAFDLFMKEKQRTTQDPISN